MILKNKKVTVIGLGKSGFASAKFLHENKALVRVSEGSDKKEVLESAGYLKSLGIDVETGGHTAAYFEDCDFIVTSPGVSKESMPLKLATQRQIPVISEIELACHSCRGNIIAVTASNGKTTTCNLIHRILKDAGHKSILCGNVGYSFLSAIPEIDRQTDVVLELSSFQLEDSPGLRPKIAVLLNISPNHLDRHRTLENYTAAKQKIYLNQKKSDVVVLNADDPLVSQMAKTAPGKVFLFSKSSLPEGLFYREGKIILRQGSREKVFLDATRFKLRGEHNLENILAAASVGYLLKISPEKMQKTLDSFKTLEHRIEPLGAARGIHFMNDSKSTTLASTRAAILTAPKPLILISGGRNKGASFAEIENILSEHVKSVVLYGEAREAMAVAWKKYGHVKKEQDFRKAVELAFQGAEKGDTILLSPMCTSFDQFSSYEQRGEVFKKIVEELKGK